jgi:3-ketosteroid 9alpha-monooxygenase subunit B
MATQLHPLRVHAVVPESDDACSLLLEVPPALHPSFRYLAGQFLTVSVCVDGVTLRRCYSLSSAPELDPRPRITVKRVPGGRVSNWICDTVKAGDLLQVALPEGRFVLDPREQRPLVLIGGGSGLTPLLSLLKVALATTERRVCLLTAQRSPSHRLFHAEISALAAAHPHRLAVHDHLDSERGHLTRAALAPLLTPWLDGTVYLCGPTPFMELVEAALNQLGLPDAQLHIERFASPTDPERLPETPEPISQMPDAFTLRLDGKQHRVPYLAGESLLSSALSHGLPAPHACQEGFCGSCMAHLTQGQVHMRTHDALSAKDVQRGRVLLCQARPIGPGELALSYDAASFAPPPAAGPQVAGLSRSRLAAVLAVGAALVGAVRWLH